MNRPISKSILNSSHLIPLVPVTSQDFIVVRFDSLSRALVCKNSKNIIIGVDELESCTLQIIDFVRNSRPLVSQIFRVQSPEVEAKTSGFLRLMV
jgi:hypothetical protein